MGKKLDEDNYGFRLILIMCRYAWVLKTNGWKCFWALQSFHRCENLWDSESWLRNVNKKRFESWKEGYLVCSSEPGVSKDWGAFLGNSDIIISTSKPPAEAWEPLKLLVGSCSFAAPPLQLTGEEVVEERPKEKLDMAAERVLMNVFGTCFFFLRLEHEFFEFSFAICIYIYIYIFFFLENKLERLQAPLQIVDAFCGTDLLDQPYHTHPKALPRDLPLADPGRFVGRWRMFSAVVFWMLGNNRSP